MRNICFFIFGFFVLTNLSFSQKKVQTYYDEYDDKPEKNVKNWDFQFFNQLEWFSFLINEKKLKDEKLINFFKPAVIDWYDNMFVKHFEKSVIEDSEQFEEFKKLYKKFQGD